MADNVKFKAWQCHDDRPAVTREAAIKWVLAFAGIHDTSFTSAIQEGFSGSLSDFEGSEGTWTVPGNLLQGVAGAAAQWFKIRHTEELEMGYVATFTKYDNRGAFLFNQNDSYQGYMVRWSATDVGVAETDGATTTDLISLPMEETGQANVTVMVWPRQYTSIDQTDDIVVGLWFDGKHLLTHVIPYEEKGKKIGFAVWQSETITFDTLRVPQFHHVIEWTSVDPGERAASSLARVRGQDDNRIQARYDGSVKVWRNDSVTSDWTVAVDRPKTLSKSYRIHWPSHYRLVGALHEADTLRSGTQGHVFELGQDPNSLTRDETYDDAERQHKKLEEQATGLLLTMQPNPVIEPEDVLTYDADKWRVTVISYRIRKAGRMSYILDSQVQTRECLAA